MSSFQYRYIIPQVDDLEMCDFTISVFSLFPPDIL